MGVNSEISHFAMRFILDKYGPCPQQEENPEDEARWHARLGLLFSGLQQWTREHPPADAVDTARAESER